MRNAGVLTALGIAAFAALAGSRSTVAQTERFVNVYNWSDYVAPTVLDDFTRQTGIRVRYDTFDSNDTLETKLLAGKSGYDVVVPTAYFLERQIKAGVFQKLDKAKLPNLVNAWPEITNGSPSMIPATNTLSTTCGVRSASAYNVKKAREILGPDATIDSWDARLRPGAACRVQGLRRPHAGLHPDDILPTALRYLGLDPNSADPDDLETAADLVTKCGPWCASSIRRNTSMPSRAEKFASWLAGPATSSRLRNVPPRPRTASTSAMRSPKEGTQMFFDNFAIPKDAKQCRRGPCLYRLSDARGCRGKEHELPILREWEPRQPKADRSGDPLRSHHLSRRSHDGRLYMIKAHDVKIDAADEQALDPDQDGPITSLWLRALQNDGA